MGGGIQQDRIGGHASIVLFTKSLKRTVIIKPHVVIHVIHIKTKPNETCSMAPKSDEEDTKAKLHENERLMEFFGSEGLEDSKAKFARAFQRAREEAKMPRGEVKEAADEATAAAAEEAALDEMVVWPPLDADPGVLRQHLLDELRRDTESSVFYGKQPSSVQDELCPYDEDFAADSKPQLYADAFKKEWTGFYT